MLHKFCTCSCLCWALGEACVRCSQDPAGAGEEVSSPDRRSSPTMRTCARIAPTQADAGAVSPHATQSSADVVAGLAW